MGTEVSSSRNRSSRDGVSKRKENDYVFIDTAGRLHIDETLMDELKQIKELTQPNRDLASC